MRTVSQSITTALERFANLKRAFNGWFRFSSRSLRFNCDLSIPIIICVALKDKAVFEKNIIQLYSLGYTNIFCIAQDGFQFNHALRSKIKDVVFDADIKKRFSIPSDVNNWYYQQVVKILSYEIFSLKEFEGVYLLDADTLLTKGIPYYDMNEVPCLLYSYESPAVYERCVSLMGISGCSEYSFVSHQCYYPLYTYNYFFRKMDLTSFIQWIKSLQNEGILFSEYQIIGELRSLNEKLEPVYFANKDIRTLSDFRIKSVSLSQSIQDWKSKRSLFSWIYYKMLGGFYFK